MVAVEGTEVVVVASPVVAVVASPVVAAIMAVGLTALVPTLTTTVVGVAMIMAEDGGVMMEVVGVVVAMVEMTRFVDALLGYDTFVQGV